MTNINERIIEAQFYKSLTRYNIRPRQTFTPLMDGQIHRFATAEDRGSETSGAYKIYPDLIPGNSKGRFITWPTWFIQDYRQHSQMIKCTFKASDLTENQRAEIFQTVNDPETQKRRAAEKAEKDKLQKEIEAIAIQNAWREYSSSNDLTLDHPYLVSKHLLFDSAKLGFLSRIKTKKENGDYGTVGDLMIPLYNSKLIHQLFKSDRWIFSSERPEEFQSLQLIKNTLNEDGKYQKGIYKGTKLSGACFPLILLKKIDKNFEDMITFEIPNETPDIFIICEGAATAASLFTAFNYEVAVIAAMTCHNIINVAEQIRNFAPNAKIIIAADNDEAGIKAADETIKAGYADKKKIPPVNGTDWNDFYIKKGTI